MSSDEDIKNQLNELNNDNLFQTTHDKLFEEINEDEVSNKKDTRDILADNKSTSDDINTSHHFPQSDTTSNKPRFIKKDDNTGRTIDYLIVNQLPTAFRSLPNITEVYVRGLNLLESLSLSKTIFPGAKIDEVIAELANIYSEAIKGVDVYDLELVDFTILQILSSLWTIDGFGWIPNMPCAQVTEEGTRCPGIIKEKITLQDFNFQDPEIKESPIMINIAGKKVPVGGHTVKDMIEKKRLIDANIFPEIDPSVLSNIIDYAALIKDNHTLDEKVNFIKYAQPYELKQLYEISNSLLIKMDLIEKECPICKKTTKIKMTLNEIRGYP